MKKEEINALKIKLEILEYSYWEHYKFGRDIAFVSLNDDKKKGKIEDMCNLWITEINQIKDILKEHDIRTGNHVKSN